MALGETQFRDALHKARDRTNALALAWMRRGARVFLPPLAVAGVDGTRGECVDTGDVFVTLRVEHKVRGISWTGREDYPYPDVLIDETYKLAKDETLLAYVIESADGKSAAVVYPWTKPHWVARNTFDKRAGRGGSFTFCPKKFVRFCKPDEVLACEAL